MTIVLRTTSATSHPDHHVYLILIARSTLFSWKYTKTCLTGPPGKGIGREGREGKEEGIKEGGRGKWGRGSDGKGKGEGLTVMKNSYFRPCLLLCGYFAPFVTSFLPVRPQEALLHSVFCQLAGLWHLVLSSATFCYVHRPGSDSPTVFSLARR